MKPKKQNRKNDSSKRIILKTTSIAIIIIFLIIITIGIAREYYNHRPAPTESQVSSAEKAVETSMKNQGENPSNYNFSVSKRIKIIGQNSNSEKIIQICAYNSQTRQLFYVSASSAEILLETKTEVYNPSIDINKFFKEQNPCHFE